MDDFKVGFWKTPPTLELGKDAGKLPWGPVDTRRNPKRGSHKTKRGKNGAEGGGDAGKGVAMSRPGEGRQGISAQT